MPKQLYAIERNGPKRLEISWSGFWKDFTVKFDGLLIATLTKEEVHAGKEMKLPDGSMFKVHMRKVGLSQELALLRDGVALPGSGADPVQLVKTTAGILYFLAGLNALIGVVALVWQVELLLRLGAGYPSFVVAAIFGVLGFFTMQRSRIALGIAMALYGLDGISTVFIAISGGGGTPPYGSIIMHVLFLTAMWRGFKAMGELNAPKEQSP